MIKIRRGTYCIVGLGTTRVSAFVSHGDAWRPDPKLTADVARRAAGHKRAYRLDENAFDRLTGKQFNWVGSDRGGGKSGLKPGGIGDVNVGPASAEDWAAKAHDIGSWLSANFEVGSVVWLRQGGRLTKYNVYSLVRVNATVVMVLPVAAAADRVFDAIREHQREAKRSAGKL